MKIREFSFDKYSFIESCIISRPFDKLDILVFFQSSQI